MKYQIDQSGKIEQTNKDTIIGLANGKTYTVLLKRQIKRKLQVKFRRKGKPKLFVYRTFIACVVLLIKHSDIKHLSNIIIDREYSGLEKLLADIFMEMAEKTLKIVPEVSFSNIGKKSNAHRISYLTTKGKIKPNRLLNLKEIEVLIFK